MKKAFIFDMDGVLVDSEPVHYQIMTKVFEKVGLDLSQEYRHSLIGMAGIPIWMKLCSDFKLKKTPSEYLKFHRDVFFSEIENIEIPEVKGIFNLLEMLKERQLKLAVASSSEMNLIDLFLNRLNIRSYFQEIISGADLPKSKPSPEIFILTAKRLDCLPLECIVLEDSKNGVLAAKSAQMRCIGYQNPNSGDQDLSLADFIVKDIKKICDNLDFFLK